MLDTDSKLKSRPCLELTLMDEQRNTRGPAVIATWPFDLPASQAAWRVLSAGASPLDAAVAGATWCEDDESVDSVGYGGLPDASGGGSLHASALGGRAPAGAGAPRPAV